MQTPETYVLILRLVLAGVLGGLGVCSLRAEEKSANVVFVTWTSTSGYGPFKELSHQRFKSSGWLRWLAEPHRFYCDVQVEANEECSIGISFPEGMELTHVSINPERAYRLKSREDDLGWCVVRRECGCAEMTIWPGVTCRLFHVCFALHECVWSSLWRKENKAKYFEMDTTAAEYDETVKLYKTMESTTPLRTPFAATRTAERIFIDTYGNDVISERPWRVTDTNGFYLITGTLPEGHVGGVSQIKIRKHDGHVWLYLHGK